MKKLFSIIVLMMLLIQPVPTKCGVGPGMFKDYERGLIIGAISIAVISPIVVFGGYKLLRVGYNLCKKGFPSIRIEYPKDSKKNHSGK